MSRRAYHPRRSTVDLVRRIEALPGIAKVEIHAPHHGRTVEPARIVVTLDSIHTQPGEPVSTMFSMKQAREWLAAEEAEAAR